MPALTISTNTTAAARSSSSSPTRPPVSPLTPTRELPPGPGASRPALTHAQPDQVGVPPPAPEPLAFESNPDVIALKSAISILQLQRQRATTDIVALQRAKEAAVADPRAFVADLAAGKVNGPPRPDSDSSDDDNDDDDDAGEGSSKQPEQRPWNSIPTPQNIVRCPPINWSQYAVVGESLDKLHAEQVTRPVQGTPATVGANGMYEFRGGEGRQERYVGVAAPYDPLKDKVDRKPKGRK